MDECSFESHASTPPLTRCGSMVREFEDNLTEDVRNKRKSVFFSEADMARVHQQYLSQIDTLEAVIQEKETQLQRYQQTIADQACELASLCTELSYLKTRGSAVSDPESRAGLLDSLCSNRIERLFRRVRPGIVRINLAVGRLGDVCDRLFNEREQLETLFDSSHESPFSVIDDAEEVPLQSPRESDEYSRTTILRDGKYEDSAFQECKAELLVRRLTIREEPQSPSTCSMCAALNRQVEKLQEEVRKHKKFIGRMKGSIETLVTEKNVL